MSLTIRAATRADVPSVVALLRDDILGQTREVQALDAYYAAFEAMQREGGNTLYVAEIDTQIVATYQLTFISGLSLTAARRAMIESVRVATDLRGQGIGAKLFRDAEVRARAAGCSLLQLTTNKTRKDAHRFYDRLGYVDSHVGYKKPLT